MSHRKTLAVVAPIFVVLLLAAVGIAQAGTKPDPRFMPPTPCGGGTPADAWCLELGYKCEIKSGEKGEYAICIFPDGSECSTWDFFRGACGQKFSYCVKKEAQIESRVDDMGTWTAQYAVCLFSDHSECLEQDYFSGACKPGQCTHWILVNGGCIK